MRRSHCPRCHCPQGRHSACPLLGLGIRIVQACRLVVRLRSGRSCTRSQDSRLDSCPCTHSRRSMCQRACIDNYSRRQSSQRLRAHRARGRCQSRRCMPDWALGTHRCHRPRRRRCWGRNRCRLSSRCKALSLDRKRVCCSGSRYSRNRLQRSMHRRSTRHSCRTRALRRTARRSRSWGRTRLRRRSP